MSQDEVLRQSKELRRDMEKQLKSIVEFLYENISLPMVGDICAIFEFLKFFNGLKKAAVIASPRFI